MTAQVNCQIYNSRFMVYGEVYNKCDYVLIVHSTSIKHT